MEQTSPIEPPANRVKLLLLYCSCILATLVFVNLFGLFAFLNKIFGPSFTSLAPILLPMVFLFLFVPLFLWRSAKKRRLRLGWIISGMAISLLALVLTDPAYPVKRIHVMEYLLLSFLVRYTLAHRVMGLELVCYGFLFTAILGVHDELLQGFHPERTFGIRDITVNAVASLGGSSLWHGLDLFYKKSQALPPAEGLDNVPLFYLGWVVLALLLFLLPLRAFTHQALPYWMALPLSATLLLWALLYQGRRQQRLHGPAIISSAALAVLIYPAMINVFAIPFY